MESHCCGNMNRRWFEDLALGKGIERDFLERVMVAFQNAYQTFGDDTRFDIGIPELDVTVEVKFDIKSLETGNIVIEYFHRRPSGILVSEATHWLFVTGEEEIWISQRELTKCLLVNAVEPRQIHGPEDRHPKYVFLLRVDLLRACANGVRKLGT